MPIGIFDSGYGGLTILREIAARMPQYDYLYLGDNARAPYGTRSFDVVYDFTLQAVRALFSRGCRLVIIACNTASAKALRSIQQNDLPKIDPSRRVLGVIRPTIEVLPDVSESGHIGLLATPGTVASHSYALELEKTDPGMVITERACPMWVPLIENCEADSPGADYFVKKYIDGILNDDPLIDTLVLGCTHYPLLYDKIRKYTPAGVNIFAQGKRVAESLEDYLMRHPEIEKRCSKGGKTEYLTTENPDKFDSLASVFLGREVKSAKIALPEEENGLAGRISLDEIKRKLPGEAIPLLDEYLAACPDDDEAYTVRGMKHWALGERSLAVKDYLRALSINPDSRARHALDSANAIFDFYNKDLLNP